MLNTEPKEIKGILFKGADLDSWDDKKFNDYFLFLDFFYGTDGKIHATKDAVQAAQQYKLASPFIAELLERVDVPFNPEEPDIWNYRKFFMRLQIMIRAINIKLKNNPELLLPSLVEKEKDKAHCVWMLTFYNEENKPIEKEFVIKKEKKKQELLVVGENITPGERLALVISKVADIYDMIAGSITAEEIDRLNVKDKIAALQKLSYLHQTVRKTPVKNLNFVKINTTTGGKEELEEALLNFNDDE